MSAVKTYSIGGGVSLFISLIGTGIQYRWPEQKWIGTSLIILGGIGLVIFIVAGIVRKLTIKEYERLHPTSPPTGISSPHIDAPITNTNNPIFAPVFAPSFNQSQAQSQRQSQRQSQAQPSRPDPVFECKEEDDIRVVSYGIDWNNSQIIRESYAAHVRSIDDLPDGINAVEAVLARIRYRPDKGVEQYLYLRAHISFYDSNQVFQKRIIKGIWDGNPLKMSDHIYAGGALELIVALVLVPVSEQVILAEYNEQRQSSYYGDDIVIAPNFIGVTGEKFFVKVDLIPKKSGEVLDTQTMFFELSLKPKVTLARTAPFPA